MLLWENISSQGKQHSLWLSLYYRPLVVKIYLFQEIHLFFFLQLNSWLNSLILNICMEECKYLWIHFPWNLPLIVLLYICTVPLSFSFSVLHHITKANLLYLKTNHVIHLINKCVSFQYKYDWHIWPESGEQPLFYSFAIQTPIRHSHFSVCV